MPPQEFGNSPSLKIFSLSKRFNKSFSANNPSEKNKIEGNIKMHFIT